MRVYEIIFIEVVSEVDYAEVASWFMGVYMSYKEVYDSVVLEVKLVDYLSPGWPVIGYGSLLGV